MTLLATIDELACVSHGDCAAVAPAAFRIDDIGVATGAGSDEELLAAAHACPSVAITICDAKTGEQVYP
jgi:ferredoxin